MLVVIGITTVITVLILIRLLKRKGTVTYVYQEAISRQSWNYKKLRTLVHSQKIRLPAMFVDLDMFDANVQRLANIARAKGKTIRVATKSIRCVELIKRVLVRGGGIMKGLMCFSVEEAAFLAEKGLDDFYVAYPTVQPSDIKAAHSVKNLGKRIVLTVDSVECVNKLNEVYEAVNREQSDKNSGKLAVAVDLDTSYKFGPVCLGLCRSRIDTLDKFVKVADAIKSSSHLELVGVMGYEAAVAGLPDKDPFAKHPNFIIRLLKPRFMKNCIELRRKVKYYCEQSGIKLEFINGGGSGNIRQACSEEVTEVTVGSAFLQAKTFDYFVSNQCYPACCFALQATRVTSEFICCQSGGFISSGSISLNKQPIPYANPLDLHSYPDEGFGEVQTPLRKTTSDTQNQDISLGDPVFFRPAKSGEIAEHFNYYYLKKGYNIENVCKTYRGAGKAFH